MKRLICLLFVALVVSGAASEAFAQTDVYVRQPYKFTVSVESGLAIPNQPSEFSDLWNTTWPFSGGIGYAVFSWLEIGGGLTYGTFGISEIPAKASIGIVSTAAIQGGDITVVEYYGRARFIAIPSQRINPFGVFSLGTFHISHDNLDIAETTSGPTATPAFSNSMEDVNGLHVSFGGGLQYAMDEIWVAYSKFSWVMNLNEDFEPKALVASPDGTDNISGDSMQYGIVSVGIMIRL
jgi:hypothetical protein